MIDLSPPHKSLLPADLTPADIAALELALRLLHADPHHTDQAEWRVREDGWLEASKFASYSRQCDALNLCAEVAPCDVADVKASLQGPNDVSWHWGEHRAAKLVRRMAAFGISRFHPNPLEAIEQAQQTRR